MESSLLPPTSAGIDKDISIELSPLLLLLLLHMKVRSEEPQSSSDKSSSQKPHFLRGACRYICWSVRCYVNPLRASSQHSSGLLLLLYDLRQLRRCSFETIHFTLSSCHTHSAKSSGTSTAVKKALGSANCCGSVTQSSAAGS